MSKHYILTKEGLVPTAMFTEKEIKEMIVDRSISAEGGVYIGRPLPKFLWKFKARKY